MALRDYQERAIRMTYDWLSRNPGNLCISMPMGSGKSHVIAELCKGIMRDYPDSKIVMLTHVKELIEQDMDKLIKAWPEAPLGVYSAGLGRKDVAPITFAGIQSARDHADLFGRVDLVLIDEAHLINNSEIGTYRAFLTALKEVNPIMRAIGLTATPYRLGQGLIYGQEGCIFDGAIEPVTIEELIARGYLLPLRSKLTEKQISMKGVKKIAGEYSLKDLDARVNTSEINNAVIEEIVTRGKDRKKWLVFCVGVSHALAVRDALRAAGIDAETVTGATPKEERRKILDDFRNGSLRAVTNANVLTTGFDAPCIDLIAMLRATESPGLFVQMAGRGMRVAPNKTDCLYLDFVANIRRHGPIIDVNPPKKKGQSTEQARTKICPRCEEICSLTAKTCPACGYEFAPEPREVKPITKLYNDDIMAVTQTQECAVTHWRWRFSTSRAGNPMLSVTYYARGTAPYGQWPKEYFPFNSSYRMGQLQVVMNNCGIDFPFDVADIESVIEELNAATPPSTITVAKKKGQKYINVVNRRWDKEEHRIDINTYEERTDRALGTSAVRYAFSV